MGDRGGFDDLEKSIEIASRGNFVSDLLRGHNNRQALYFLYGDIPKARAAEEVTLELARHFGQQAFVRFVETGPSVGNRYLAGEWDDALHVPRRSSLRRKRACASTRPVRFIASGA